MSAANAPFVRVYEIVARIPPGRVATYGWIALQLGKPQGARTVGWAMRQCPVDLPWHRVVNAQGRCSLRERAALQRALLEAEGVAFGQDERIDLARFGWDGDESNIRRSGR